MTGAALAQPFASAQAGADLDWLAASDSAAVGWSDSEGRSDELLSKARDLIGPEGTTKSRPVSALGGNDRTTGDAVESWGRDGILEFIKGGMAEDRIAPRSVFKLKAA